jgi:hypothetical protein
MDKHFIDEPEYGAAHLGRGGVVAHAFANIYVISTSADARTVQRVNLMKGRPRDQVGSIITTRPHIEGLFDWSQLPDGLTRRTALEIIDALYSQGPFGFRGPAAIDIPAHMSSLDGNVRTTQIIAPGYSCPSNGFLDASLERLGETILYVTSANRSRHQTGAVEEPAHYEADGLSEDFSTEPDFLILRHRDEARARSHYPRYAAMSTTVLALHKLGTPDDQGRPTLIVERHGSLHLDDLQELVGQWGFGLALAPLATRRLTQRDYPTPELLERRA